MPSLTPYCIAHQRVNADELIVFGFILNFTKMQHLESVMPAVIVKEIIHFLACFLSWSKESNHDRLMSVSDDGLTVATSLLPSDTSHQVYSSIFLDHWLSRDGEYTFEFQIDGQPEWDDAFAIGVVSKEYNLAHPEGIGYDTNGASWYAWGSGSSCSYHGPSHTMFSFGLCDAQSFSLRITIKKGLCACQLEIDVKSKTIIEDLQTPINIGVSTHTTTKSLRLQMTDHFMNWK